MAAAMVAACNVTTAATDGGPVDTGGRLDMGLQDDLGPQPADTGPADMGPADSGPARTVGVRLAHLIPGGAAETANGATLPVRLCVYPHLAGQEPSPTGTYPALPPAGPQGVLPFRVVSGYNSMLFAQDADLIYRVKVFSAATLPPTEMNCPAPNLDGGPAAGAVITQEVPASMVTNGSDYTVAALGLVPGTLGAAPGALPAVCGLTFNGPCGAEQAPKLGLFLDDNSPVTGNNARVRVLHGIPNAPPVDVCYDPDALGSGMAESPIAAGTAFGTASAYATLPAPVTTGFIVVHIAAATPCTGTVLAPIPVPATALIPPQLVPLGATGEIRVGDVLTIFASGRVVPSAPPPGDAGVDGGVDAGTPDAGPDAGPRIDPASVAFIPWLARARAGDGGM